MAPKYLKSGGAGDKLGNDWDNAWDYPAFVTWAVGTPAAGQIVYIKNDTYASATDVAAGGNHGTLTAPIRLIGVDGESTTQTEHGNHPHFSMASGANRLLLGNYWDVNSLHVTGNDSARTVEGKQGTSFRRCRFNGNHATSDTLRLWGNGATLYDSIVTAQAAADGIRTNSNSRILFNDIQGGNGIVWATSTQVIIGNKIHDCADGIQASGYLAFTILNNTFYNNTVGIDATTAYAGIVMFNIFSGNTTPAVWTTEEKSVLWDWNCWHSNATPTLVSKGDNAVNEDPSFVDAGSGDFTPQNANIIEVGPLGQTIGAVQPTGGGSPNLLRGLLA